MMALQWKLRNGLLMLIMFGVIIITYLFFQSERLTSVERKRRENQSDISTSDAAIVNETADKGDAKCKNVNRTIETYEAGNWQKVDENGMVYVYSAYISWSGDNEVFIIGVEKPGDATEQGEIIIGQKTEELVYYCVYWYMGHFTNSKAEAKKIVSPLMERKKGRSVIFRCRLPDSATINLPEAVSLVQMHKCITPRNYLPLNQEINQNANITFTVCIPPQLHSIDREMILIEWMELNRLLGAEHFVFYRHLSKPTAIDNVLRAYSEWGWIEVVDWTHINKLPFDIDQYGRFGATNDCYNRQRFKSSYIAILDLNEYIIPKNPETLSWRDMMQQIPSIRKGAFIFHVSYFRTDWPDASANDNATNVANAKIYGLETLLKLSRENQISPPGMETRYIVQSHRVKVLGVSSISVMNPDYSSTLVQPSIALVHRYVFGTVYGVEKLQDDSIPAKYGDKLVETVKESWTDLHRVNTK